MTFYHHETRTARTAHRCYDCLRIIDPGERYNRGAGMGNAYAWTWKDCAHCKAILPLLPYGDEGYSQDDYTEWDPGNPLHLMRLRVQLNRQWRRADGTFYPVPIQVWDDVPYGNTVLHRVVDVRPGDDPAKKESQ